MSELTALTAVALTLATSSQVRAVSRELGLPNWNHAASPCLRSRLAFGVQATPERLVLVEKVDDTSGCWVSLVCARPDHFGALAFPLYTDWSKHVFICCMGSK